MEGQSTVHMMTGREQVVAVVENEPMRVLVERYPQVMPLLAGCGMDLCCGGGHTVPEAAGLHGLDVAAVVGQVADIIEVAGS